MPTEHTELCVTLMMFIYVYYGLFVYINLEDFMSFFHGFFFLMIDFLKNSAGFYKNRPGIARPIFGKSWRFVGEFG
jgi:hypothetical protein